MLPAQVLHLAEDLAVLLGQPSDQGLQLLVHVPLVGVDEVDAVQRLRQGLGGPGSQQRGEDRGQRRHEEQRREALQEQLEEGVAHVGDLQGGAVRQGDLLRRRGVELGRAVVEDFAFRRKPADAAVLQGELLQGREAAGLHGLGGQLGLDIQGLPGDVVHIDVEKRREHRDADEEHGHGGEEEGFEQPLLQGQIPPEIVSSSIPGPGKNLSRVFVKVM